MAIEATWSISDMKRNQADGGVFVVYWQLETKNTVDNENDPVYTTMDGGKLRLEYDADAADFTPYTSLTEQQVLGWVWDSLRNADETAEEAKTRVENERIQRVQDQIDRAASDAKGLPW